jgi:hypothetical protein
LYYIQDLVSTEVFVFFEEPDPEEPTHYGSMIRGVIKKYDPRKKKGEFHFIEYSDGDKNWVNLLTETVIWPDGTVTGQDSKWKEEAEVVERKHVGDSGGKRTGRQAKTAAGQQEEEAEKAEEQPKAEEAAAAAESPQPVEAPQPPAAVAKAEDERQESKKRKAPSSAEKTVAETTAAEKTAAPLVPQAPQQQQQQQQQQQEEQKLASPLKQPPPPASTEAPAERQPKKAKVDQQQKLPAVKPPPPPSGVAPRHKDTTAAAALGPLKSQQPGSKQQQKPHQQQQQQQKKPAAVPGPKPPPLAAKHNHLKNAIDKYLAALETLKKSSETIKSIVKELETEDLGEANKVGIPKLVASTVKQTLQPPSASGGGGAGGWFEVNGTKWLNDVPESMAYMRELLNTWYAVNNRPAMPEGPELKAWLIDRAAAGGAAAGGPGGPAGASGSGSGGEKKPAQQQQQEQPAKQQAAQPQQQPEEKGKEEEPVDTLIPSTGNGIRDMVVRVMAHALVTASTPIDAAREMEQTCFYQLCRDSPPEPTEAYLDRMRTLHEHLSPNSQTCYPILRYMLISGIIAPAELVNITAEKLKIKIDEAIKQMGQCRSGWLSEQLRNVQLPYNPPEPAAAAAAEPAAAPEQPAPAQTAPLPAVEEPPGAVAPALVGAVEGADDGTKAADMEVD